MVYERRAAASEQPEVLTTGGGQRQLTCSLEARRRGRADASPRPLVWADDGRGESPPRKTDGRRY